MADKQNTVVRPEGKAWRLDNMAVKRGAENRSYIVPPKLNLSFIHGITMKCNKQ